MTRHNTCKKFVEEAVIWTTFLSLALYRLQIKVSKLDMVKMIVISCYTGYIIKDTHRENTSSNKTQALTKSMNMGIWEIVALLGTF